MGDIITLFIAELAGVVEPALGHWRESHLMTEAPSSSRLQPRPNPSVWLSDWLSNGFLPVILRSSK